MTNAELATAFLAEHDRMRSGYPSAQIYRQGIVIAILSALGVDPDAEWQPPEVEP